MICRSLLHFLSNGAVVERIVRAFKLFSFNTLHRWKKPLAFSREVGI